MSISCGNSIPNVIRLRNLAKSGSSTWRTVSRKKNGLNNGHNSNNVFLYTGNPSTGRNWYKSPTAIIFSPPNGWSQSTISLKLWLIIDSMASETMLISSIMTVCTAANFNRNSFKEYCGYFATGILSKEWIVSPWMFLAAVPVGAHKNR